ncbi:MAG: hypothetical protein V1721_07945 [Pseudomonadota bacterium]
MRKIIGIFGLGALMVVGFSGAAAASTYVWKDNVNGFTFSFPDSWTMQTEDAPTTRIRIAGPIAEDVATCRVKAEKDGRLKIYPKYLMTEAVSATLDRAFWEQELAGHEKFVITDYFVPASLGSHGDATAIRTSFVQEIGKGKMDMYGEMIGSIYGDTRYIVSCTAKSAEFKKYAPVFASIMGSVEFDAKYHPFAVGYYRDFLADPELKLPRSKPGTITPKSEFVLSSGH